MMQGKNFINFFFQKYNSPFKPVLNGLSQIMLQENAFTGILFLAGIFYGSAWMGVAALLAVFTGTFTALLLKFNKENIEKGLYGFSASLTGVALLLFFRPTLPVWTAVVIGSVMAACLQHFFLVKKLPVFTLPFILVTWVLVYLLKIFYPTLEVISALSHSLSVNYFYFTVRGFGQVIFQEYLVSGILFLIAVMISSPVAACYGIAGALLSGAIAFHVFSLSAEIVNAGLFSFNAVLCAIVFSGKRIKNTLWATIAVFLSLFISIKMTEYKLLQLTFPFVAASVLVISLQKILLRTK